VLLGVVWLVAAWGATPALATPSARTTVDPTATRPLCAIGDLMPITVPSPSPLPTHDPLAPIIGGDQLAGDGLAVPDGSPPLPAGLAATSWLVADLDTGEVLGACGAHRYAAPASVQKLLLVATVLPKLNPADLVTVTPEDMNFEPGSSAVGLINGGTYTVEELFLGLLLNSGNDAANTLARVGGGERGVAGTLADMNALARSLGAWDTHAETPSGLDGPGQVTSAYDMALIFRACFASEDFRRWLRTENARLPPQPPRDLTGFAFQNDNRLLYEYPGALGGKTGFTDIARHTFVGAAERDGRRLVVTMLGAEIMPLRAWQQTASLLDWGFALPRDVTVGRLVAPGEADLLTAAPTTSATASAPIAAPDLTTGPALPSVLIAAGAGLAALCGALAIVVGVARQRRVTHRQWRADDRPLAPLAPRPAAPVDDPETTAVMPTVIDTPPPAAPPIGQPPAS
jgi:D-alanyl-D-alanine carboxypeptidase (penicillin-binding protein 5/6)